jgi:hypothetical protein
MRAKNNQQIQLVINLHTPTGLPEAIRLPLEQGAPLQKVGQFFEARALSPFLR